MPPQPPSTHLVRQAVPQREQSPQRCCERKEPYQHVCLLRCLRSQPVCSFPIPRCGINILGIIRVPSTQTHTENTWVVRAKSSSSEVIDAQQVRHVELFNSLTAFRPSNVPRKHDASQMQAEGNRHLIKMFSFSHHLTGQYKKNSTFLEDAEYSRALDTFVKGA